MDAGIVAEAAGPFAVTNVGDIVVLSLLPNQLTRGGLLYPATGELSR